MSTTPAPDQQMVQTTQTGAAVDRGRWAAKSAIQGKAMTNAMIRASRARPGMQVLDVATGLGEPAFAMARAVTPNGHVVALDLVQDYLNTAQDIAEEQGITNISFQHGNAEDMPFPNGSFDIVASRLGVMFFSNVAKGLGEMRRVLKPGGKMVAVVWAPLELNPFHLCTIALFRKHLPPAKADAPNPHRFAQPGSLSAAIKEVGFQQITEEQASVSWPWPGPPEEAWLAARQRQSSFRAAFDALSPELQEQVAEEAYQLIRAYYDGQQVNWHAVVNLVTATR